MSSSNVLSEKDVNSSLASQAGTGANKGDIKSMEYHRQMLKSKMEQERYIQAAVATTTAPTTTVGATSGLGTTTAAAGIPSLASYRALAGLTADPNASGTYSGDPKYVSPSDTIMSPCTAKLTALKGRQAGKAKPKSLFAQASAKRFAGENVFGARNAGSTTAANEGQQGNE
ncbi:hypothetical protein F4861DRAFT_500961 [Xylaria intraflava]|nr:hypothetical protein F4861DRAFT_500961 [Xylaria intraflava]